MREELWLALGVGALCGAAVGTERQWSGHADGDDAHFGGLRTFTLLGIIGSLSGWLSLNHAAAPGALLLAAACGIVVVSYVAASRRDIDGTTEVAAIVVLGTGLLAGFAEHAAASGVAAATALLLAEKRRLHGLVRLASDTGFRAGLRFGVMAAVVLPLLPNEPVAWLAGARPRQLWLLVLLFSGLSFAGYTARTWLGHGRGLRLTGLLGGLVSSTSVTLTFARLSREPEADQGGLADGAVAACTVLFPRVLIATLLLAPAVVPALASVLAVPFLIGVIMAFGGRRTEPSPASPPSPTNPLAFGAALQMAGLFQIVWFGVEYAREYFGETGLFASSLILGLTDVDALTASVALRVGDQLQPSVAAQAIVAGIAANTALKLAVALLVGDRRFGRRVSLALSMTLLGLVGSAWLARP